MKIVVTGSLGHIGRPLATALVRKGHEVTVVSSNPEKQKEIEAIGAAAVIGTVEDAVFLTAAFTGADVVYTMIPPPVQGFATPGLDIMAMCRTIARNFALAIAQSGVKRVIHLSSIGAHMAQGSGMILAHHEAENIMKAAGANITFMRPTAFYYNLLNFIGGIKSTGAIASNYGGADIVSWVSPTDIAAAIADEIETPVTGTRVRYVASEDLPCSEVASILGAAIGMPALKWLTISNEQLQQGMQAYGLPASIVAGFVEMNACMHTGELFTDYNANKPAAMGKVKMADFALEFAAAFSK